VLFAISRFAVERGDCSHIYLCLSIVQSDIICRHFFQVMLTTKNALFHIRLIPTRWYYIKANDSNEPFLTADKFLQKKQNIIYHHNSVPYLCLFDQKNKDFHEEKLTIYEQRIVYGKLHGTYKKALSKVLQTSSKSQQLINLLQEFIENKDIDEYSDLEDEF
jgi:hypothetical protein